MFSFLFCHALLLNIAMPSIESEGHEVASKIASNDNIEIRVEAHAYEVSIIAHCVSYRHVIRVYYQNSALIGYQAYK